MPDKNINLTDLELWSLLLRGDTNVLEVIYMRYYDLLLNYGMKYSTDTDFVKDCIHDVFVKLHVSNDLKMTVSVRSYLLKSLRNIIYDKTERNKHLLSIDNEFVSLSVDDSVLEAIFSKNDTDLKLSRQLVAAYSKLSSSQKMIIYLRYVKGLSYKEISNVLDINEQSSMNLLSRALAKLRKIIILKIFCLIF